MSKSETKAREENAALRRENRELRERIQSLKGCLDSMGEKMSQLKIDYENLSSTNAQLQQRLEMCMAGTLHS